MKSISSSIFGRFFGHSTKVIIEPLGIKVIVANKTMEMPWETLISPPKFTSTLFGKTLSFTTEGKTYTLTKLAYNSKKLHKSWSEQCWINVHKNRLQALLLKIEKFKSNRYLRQSSILSIDAVVQAEYKRWFPWAIFSANLGETASFIQSLAYYKQWSQADINDCREVYINKQLATYKSFFDTVESNPLTPRQQRACVIDDDNNLLLAGAGTGKTSVMVGRTGYLLHSQQATHEQILLLAYGRKAANEMDQRIKEKLATDKISATTFHSLGLDIIAQVEGVKPNLSLFSEDEKSKAKWVQSCFEKLIEEQSKYCSLVLDYFSKHYYVEKNEFDFSSLGEYYQYLNDNDIRTLKGEKVKSFGELYIANWLFNHGIEYQYEANYQHAVNTLDRTQYQPDFYLCELDIYIEYYGIDENGDCAPFINKEDYHAAMKWKRETHKQYASQCIELTYAQHKRGQLLGALSNALEHQHIVFAMLPEQAMLATLKETGRITVLAEIFAKLVGLYKGACLDARLEAKLIADSEDPPQMSKALELLQPILQAYQNKLDIDAEIDFEDMISKAISYVESGRFSSPWRYIMVDEFQDISEPRARLVKALRDNCKGSSVFAVGDDWQAIYRFSGADVSLTTGFADYFGSTTQTELNMTFRFNDQIGKVATRFISKNPAQINKTINSIKEVKKPAVSLLRKAVVNISQQNVLDEIANGALDEVLTAISRQATKPISVYLLARFWFQLPDKATLQRLNQQYPMLTIETQSFHASKGKEADYVVIMGLKEGKHGFPSKKATPAILDALLAKQEKFEHAEERRLFYVALTRAKDRVYIIADMQGCSVFVQELIEDGDVELNEFGITVNQAFVDKINCLICETGTLKLRVGQFGSFYSCSHFPLCSHKERGCRQCQSAMTRKQYPGFKSCLNPSCNEIFPLCEKCGAEMVLRNSKKGEFWGCRNYKGNEQMSCKQGIDKLKVRWQ